MGVRNMHAMVHMWRSELVLSCQVDSGNQTPVIGLYLESHLASSGSCILNLAVMFPSSRTQQLQTKVVVMQGF